MASSVSPTVSSGEKVPHVTAVQNADWRQKKLNLQHFRYATYIQKRLFNHARGAMRFTT